MWNSKLTQQVPPRTSCFGNLGVGIASKGIVHIVLNRQMRRPSACRVTGCGHLVGMGMNVMAVLPRSACSLLSTKSSSAPELEAKHVHPPSIEDCPSARTDPDRHPRRIIRAGKTSSAISHGSRSILRRSHQCPNCVKWLPHQIT